MARNVVVSIWLAVLLTLCSQLATPAWAQQRKALQTRASAPANAKPIGHLPASQQLSLAITLPLHNSQQLQTLLQQLEDPTSPNYHQYLTVAQFTEQFGPTAEEYQQVIGFAQAHGLTVTHTASNRVLLNVTGSVTNIEQAFQVTMQVYQHPTEKRTYFATNVAPTIDAGLPVLGVSGLSNYVLPHPMLSYAAGGGVHSNQTGSGPGGEFYGSDIRGAYYGSGPLTGSGQAIALAELGQWNMIDVQNYFTSVGQPLNVPIVTELSGGTSGDCPGLCNDGEEAVDIQQIISMAPGAPVLIVYEDTSGNADIDIFNAYATDNIAKQMSFSFGIGDGNAASDEQAFAEFHAQGQNFFVASGDEGANLGDGGWPGFSQNVTDVGGTDLTTASGAWSSETGWVGSGTGWCDSSNSNTGCYQSPYDAIPSYQVPVITVANGGSTTYRNLPDVAAEANTDNFWCSSGTCQGGIGGTSLAAPRWAGFVALANEQAAANGETIGFLNPTVYIIGQGAGYDTAFHDITSGSNPSGSTVAAGFTGSFTAMTGFDMVTGWGTPNGQGMIDALAPTATNPYFTLSASPSTLSLIPGGANGATTISLTSANGFTGTVTLAANILGSPTGVTASFNPGSITGSGSSILTVSTTSSTPPGTLMLVVTGTATGGIETQPAYVTLALPNFSLSASPVPIYLNQSSTATSTVTVNQQNGFTGSVSFSPVSGLPNGVTGGLNPTTTSSTSTLTLTASSTATTGVGTNINIAGTSGSIAPPPAPYVTLSVSAATGTGGLGTPVNLSSAFNQNSFYTDGTTFTPTTSMDGVGFAYSANVLTANRILNGVQFNFGSPNQLDAVNGAGQTIALPAGKFTTLQLLATGINGNQSAQPITVTYTDSSTTQITQSFSDWFSPSNNAGESEAVAMPYRDTDTGGQDTRPFNLYGYSFVLDSTKTVQSFTLPTNANVVVLAATLTTQSLGVQVGISSAFNVAGLYDNGVTFPATGGMDGGGDGCTLPAGCADAYSAQQLGLSSGTPPTLFLNGILFDLGTVNSVDCTTGCIPDEIDLNPGATISLPAGQQTSYTTLTMLGTAVQGSHTGTVTVSYATGSPAIFNQTFSDWCGFGSNSNESIAVGGFSRINSDGTLATGAACNLYAYTYTLDSTRTVQSIALVNTDSTDYTLALAISLSGNSASTPTPTPTPTPAASYSLSAGAASPASVNPGSSSTATITVTPAGGYTGSVTLTCSISPVVTGADAPTCSFSPNPVSITSGAATATLTFATISPSAANVDRTNLPRTNHSYALMLPIPGLALIALGLGSRASRRKRIWGLLLLGMLSAGLLMLTACGGGSGGNGGGGGGAGAGTPAGTYTITITGKDANGVVQTGAAATVTVTVN